MRAKTKVFICKKKDLCLSEMVLMGCKNMLLNAINMWEWLSFFGKLTSDLAQHPSGPPGLQASGPGCSVMAVGKNSQRATEQGPGGGGWG